MKANEQSINIPMSRGVTTKPKLESSAESICEFISTDILSHYQGHFAELMAGYSSYCDDIRLTPVQSAEVLQGPVFVATRNEGRSSHSDNTQSTVQQSTETPDTVISHTPPNLTFDARESVQTPEHHGAWPDPASLRRSCVSGGLTTNTWWEDLSQFSATGSLDPLEQSHTAGHAESSSHTISRRERSESHRSGVGLPAGVTINPLPKSKNGRTPACYQCYRKRVKCSGFVPCARCIQKGLDCISRDPAPTGGTIKKCDRCLELRKSRCDVEKGDEKCKQCGANECTWTLRDGQQAARQQAPRYVDKRARQTARQEHGSPLRRDASKS
jgi:hypothetical protein